MQQQKSTVKTHKETHHSLCPNISHKSVTLTQSGFCERGRLHRQKTTAHHYQTKRWESKQGDKCSYLVLLQLFLFLLQRCPQRAVLDLLLHGLHPALDALVLVFIEAPVVQGLREPNHTQARVSLNIISTARAPKHLYKNWVLSKMGLCYPEMKVISSLYD